MFFHVNIPSLSKTVDEPNSCLILKDLEPQNANILVKILVTEKLFLGKVFFFADDMFVFFRELPWPLKGTGQYMSVMCYDWLLLVLLEQ